jgi:hypothetical protein
MDDMYGNERGVDTHVVFDGIVSRLDMLLREEVRR